MKLIKITDKDKAELKAIVRLVMRYGDVWVWLLEKLYGIDEVNTAMWN